MKLTANPAWLSLPPNLGKGSGAKFLRIMKLTTIIILAACLHTSAKGVAQQTITFSGKEVSLESVFTAIKKQTNYRFFFNTDMLATASKVTLDVKNAQIEQVMNMALKDQPLTFTIKGRTIFVMKKVEEEKKSTQVERTGDPITVSGRVTDEQGQPLVGANVKVKGGSNGVTTDAQGRFTLSNVDPNASLEVSFVGHETQLLAVKGKTVFSVALGQRVGTLDETVVIAYGTTTKRFSTGNISSVKAKDIEKQPVTNPLLALQGRVPGLYITQSTGLPNSGVQVRIQGQNSLRLAGNDPLYVIDGVPFVSQMMPSLGSILGSSGGFNGNPLNFISISDIESISVLKDADATSIYGSRAANGAILITTKKGKSSEKTVVNVNMSKGWGKVTRKLDLLDIRQYLEMRYEGYANDGIDWTSSTVPADDLKLWDTTTDTDWQKELIGGSSSYTDLQFGLSGGTPNITYFIGSNYHHETTVFPGNLNDKKGSIYFNLNNSAVNQKINFQLSGTYLFDQNNLITTDLTQTAIRLPPNSPLLYKDDGSLNWAPQPNGNSSWINPLSYLERTYENKTNSLIASAVLQYSLLEWLKLESQFGYTSLKVSEVALSPLSSMLPERRASGTRSSSFGTSSVATWNIEPDVRFNKRFGKFNVDAILGCTFLRTTSEAQQINGRGFNSDQVMKDIKAAPTVTVGSNIISDYRYSALFGRVKLDFANKYLLNLSVRRDGSSRFGSANQFHNFSSIGGAWIFSNESLFLNSKNFFSFGKLKISYGVTGSDQIGEYQYMNLYNVLSTPTAYQGSTSLISDRLPNPYLQWEETKKLQFGAEMGFLNDRLMLNVDYYRNRSSNQLSRLALPYLTGFSFIQTNLDALIENRGFELSISAAPVKTKAFNWSINANVTLPKNELLNFPDLQSSSVASQYEIGYPITINKLLSYHTVDPENGLYQFLDRNGNKSSTSVSFPLDAISFINLSPTLFGGIENTLRYKTIELSFLFQFTKSNAANYYQGFYPGRFLFSTVSGVSGNQPAWVMDRWRSNGDIADHQKFSATYPSEVSTPYDNAQLSQYAFSDASYLRLKNLSLSWQVVDKIKSKLKIHNLRLYAQAQNLITITNYKGLDPETLTSGSLPPLRIVTVGIQTSF